MTTVVLRKPTACTLAELGERLRPVFVAAGALRAVAFGSYARHTADGFSDLDLAVVLETLLPPFERAALLGEAYRAIPLGLDLLVSRRASSRRAAANGWESSTRSCAKGSRSMNEAKNPHDRWLRSADEDLAYARFAATAAHHAPACFHAQLAAEKAVKSVHYLRGARVVIGHNVRALIESLEPVVAALVARLDDARDLDVFYIPTRYPNGLESGTPGEAFGPQQSARALAAAEGILAAARAAS